MKKFSLLSVGLFLAAALMAGIMAFGTDEDRWVLVFPLAIALYAGWRTSKGGWQ
jgi:hypothetical protein